MIHVLIAIPAISWQVNVALAAFIAGRIGTNGEPDRKWEFHLAFAPEVSPVQYARNILVGEFLRQKQMDLLWFIDHDMIPEPNVLDILEVDADIVSGRCLATRNGLHGMEVVVTAFTGRNEDTGGFLRVDHEPKAPIPIVGAGAANLLIKRKVLEDPRMHLPPEYTDLAGKPRSIRDEGDAPAVFRTLYKPNGNVIVGEDVDFVWRASRLGYSCMYEPLSSMGHLKTVDLSAVEQMYGRALGICITPSGDEQSRRSL